MSEIRLNIIDAKGAIQGAVHASIGDAVIAALSAEPETVGELEAALGRFNKHLEQQSLFASFDPGVNTRPWDAGVIIVDLAARLVAVESSYSDPQAHGTVNYHDGDASTNVWLSYQLAPDWVFLSSALEYESLRATRVAERKAHPPCDIRRVLYGRPLNEFIVSECLAERSKDHSPVDELGPDEVVAQSLHIRWLMTPRADLGDRTPREVILAKQTYIDLDLQSREVQWSLLNEGPPPLSRESHAYLFAGIGSHEYVIYYYLVRFLLNQCWQRVRPDRADAFTIQRHAVASVPSDAASIPTADHQHNAPAKRDSSADSATRVDQPALLLKSLEEIKQTWLNEPSDEFDGRIPAAMIESERRRIPLIVSPKDMIIDENCELCRMLASEAGEDFGPGFWHLDGSDMDHLFEFSTYETREEWEAEERRWQEQAEEFEREWSAKQAGTSGDIPF